MNSLLTFLIAYWCPALVLGIALATLAVLGLLSRRQIRWFTLLLIVSIALAVAAIGGFALSPRWAGWVLVSAITIFVCLFLVLAQTGAWRPHEIRRNP
jgi:peptidoglycan/LPS O-acetylase OafA/YrhL